MRLTVTYAPDECLNAHADSIEFVISPYLTVDEMAAVMRSMMAALGYPPDSIADAFGDDEPRGECEHGQCASGGG